MRVRVRVCVCVCVCAIFEQGLSDVLCRQARLLKLTDTAVENIRAKTGQSSSIFPYETVSKVVANSICQFTVHYLHAKHPYVYESHVAIQIVHELSLRVNAVRERSTGLRFRAELYQQRLLSDVVPQPSGSALRTSIRRLSMVRVRAPSLCVLLFSVLMLGCCPLGWRSGSHCSCGDGRGEVDGLGLVRGEREGHRRMVGDTSFSAERAA